MFRHGPGVYLSVFVLLFVNVSTEDSNNNEIVDEHADNYTFLINGGYRPERLILAKYIVSIQYNRPIKFFGDNHGCCGSIVTSRTILTAAHCAANKDSNEPIDLNWNTMTVVAGSPDLFQYRSTRRVYNVVNILIYPYYNPKTFDEDLAILHLDKQIELDAESRSIVPLTDEEPKMGMQCTAFGWGELFAKGPRPALLVYVNLSVVNPARCHGYGSSANHVQLCLGSYDNFGKSAGAGDSGGPLVCGGKLAGVCSTGLQVTDLTLFNNFPLFTFYQNVWRHKQWILANGVVRNFNVKILIFVLTKYFL